MELITSDREDQPTDSIEELDDQHDLQDERTYECMYCKHGFTTAQALGGHMNVHRKDRAKSRRSNSSNKNTGSQLFYKPCLVTSCSSNHHREGQTHEFMQSRSSPTIYDNNNNKCQNANELTTCPSRGEIRLSLSLSIQFGRLHEDEASLQKGNEDDELDLELRLGYDP